MKSSFRLPAYAIASLLLSSPVWADTTVTTTADTVTVARTPAPTPVVETTQIFVQPAATQTVVLQKQRVIFMEQRDPRNLEGRVVKVDLVGKQLVVNDSNGRDRRVDVLKPGMINHYKVDDYVQIYLTPDLTEAMTVRTKQSPDLEGDIVGIDQVNGALIVRGENGQDQRAIIRPNMIQGYQVGDRVRFYVISENGDLQEAQIIRIK